MKSKSRRDRGQATPNIWIALVIIAVVAGVALGLALNQPAPTTSAPAATVAPVLSTVEGPTPTHTSIATVPVGPIPLGATPNPQAKLTIRLDIRDAETGKPVRADILINDKLVAESTSLHEFTLVETRTKGAKNALIKVQANGYKTWDKVLRFNVEFDRLIPLGVELEPLPAAQGDGA